jgi:competence protein ComEC
VRYVAFIPASGLIAGSIIGVFVPPAASPVALTALLLSAMVGCLGWRSWRSTWLLAAVAFGFFAGGVVLSESAWRLAWRPPLRIVFEELARRSREAAAERAPRLSPDDDEVFTTVRGTLRSDAFRSTSGAAISLDVDSITPDVRGAADAGPPEVAVSGGVQATIAGSLLSGRIDSWREGRRVQMPVRLRRAARYLDPHVPDFERALARRGTTLVGTVKSGALVDVLANGSVLDELMADLRAIARRGIGQAVGRWSQRSAAIVAAIVIGDRAGLDDEVERVLQEAGTYHVIAISGGNIAILAGLLLAVFRAVGWRGRTPLVSAIVVLAAYARFVGGGASVDRATLMAILYLAARVFDQRSPPFNTLIVAAACLVAVQPLSVFDPAFVLTFGATVAILWIAPRAGAWHVPVVMRPVLSMLAASMATELLLMPVGALVFERVTFAGLALNFAAIPLMAVVQVAGMIVVPVSLVSVRAAAGIGWVAHVAAAALVRSASLVEYVPSVSFRVAAPAWWVIVVYYSAIIAMAMATRRSRLLALRIAAVAVAGIWIVAQPWTVVAAAGDGRLHATFIDVGQGDAAFVRFPRGKTLLVDAGGLVGGGFDMGDRVVAPILRAAGVRRLDILALTHGDPDHIGGGRSILREFRPKQVWEGVPVPSFPPLRALREDADAVAAAWISVKSGDRSSLDEVEVVVWRPEVAEWERQKVRNDDSIVMELRWKGVSILLTGDIGKPVERPLAGLMPSAPLRVVKVPHHGSLTSSTAEFVRAVAPRVAVFSVGRSNRFGHPAPDVVERYREAGAEIFRTDRDGAVSLETDGRTLAISTFSGRRFSISSRGG